MTRRARGDILSQTILFVAIVFSLVLSMSSLMFSYLRWGDHGQNHERARLAATSALNRAIGHLKKDQSFTSDIVWKADGLEETALLTFDPDRGVPYSTNNTRNSLAVEAYQTHFPLSDGRVIPNAVHLVAVGTCRNARYVAEAEITWPAADYALASTGSIQTRGDLEVFGVESLADSDSTHPDDRKKSDIISNSTDGTAIVLTAGEVSGDLRSTGGIQPGAANVDGEILDNQAEPSDLPKLDFNRPAGSDPATDKTLYLSDFDFTKNPALAADSTHNLEMSPTEALADTDVFDITELRVRVNAGGPSSAPLELNRGVLLEDGTLFVDGNLVIRNGLNGRGAVLATGKITIDGPTQVLSSQVAVFGGKGVEISGSPTSSSRFRGLVISMSDFKADNVQIDGTALCSGPETQIGPGPQMILDNVKFVHAPDANKLDIVVHVELQDTLQGGIGSIGGSQIGLLHEGTFYTFTGDPNASQAEKEAQIQATYQALLGVQGETHPMAEGQVMLKRSDGTYQGVSQLTGASKQMLKEYNNKWTNYVDKLKVSEVKEVEIFRVDLNRFTSGSSRTKILYYR